MTVHLLEETCSSAEMVAHECVHISPWENSLLASYCKGAESDTSEVPKHTELLACVETTGHSTNVYLQDLLCVKSEFKPQAGNKTYNNYFLLYNDSFLTWLQPLCARDKR